VIGVRRAVHIPLVLVGLIMAGCAASSAGGTVKQFHRHVEKGEIEAASEMVTGALVWMIGQEKVEAALVAESKEISEKGGFARLDIVSEETVGTVSEVVVRVTYGNGEIEEEDYELTKIDGRWMLTPGMDK